jgi:DNA-binding CsgD family transcriptional regulator
MVGQYDIEQAKVARLTDKQRECMRLVVMRKSSKEIARELGIAKPTVDQRVANARQILGARNRDEAAIIFARGSGEYDRVIYDSARVPLIQSSTECSDPEARQEFGLRLEESAIPFSGITEHRPISPAIFGWSPSVDIGTSGRLLIIVGLTVGILSIVLIGLAVAESLKGLLIAS